MAALRSWTVPWRCCWWQQSDYILISLTYNFCSSHFCGQRRSWDWQQAQVVLPRLFLGQRHLFDWEIWWLVCGHGHEEVISPLQYKMRLFSCTEQTGLHHKETLERRWRKQACWAFLSSIHPAVHPSLSVYTLRGWDDILGAPPAACPTTVPTPTHGTQRHFLIPGVHMGIYGNVADEY